MSRRARSQNQAQHYLLLFCFSLLLSLGVYYFFGQAADPYRTLSPLEISTYYENANSLRGNTYKIRGVVKNSLFWDPTHGRIISFVALNSDNKETDPVAILVPKSFNSLNLQRGQQFHIKAEVGEHGLLIARDLKKI